MVRNCLMLLMVLALAGPASAATWAEATFDELAKDFGSVPRGPTLSHPFRLVNKTKGDITIASVRVSCGCVSANALKTTLKPGEETAIQARMDTNRFSGTKSVTIYVQFSQPQWEEVRLVVQANSRDDVIVSPESLALGRAKRGTSPTATVSVSLLSSQAKVTGVQSESNYVQTTLKETKKENGELSYSLTAKLRADAPVGKWYTDVWLKTSNPAMPKVRVPLTVEIESALSVSPESVSLGQVAVGNQVERKVIVRGTQPFRITDVRGADGEVIVNDNANDNQAIHVLTVTLKGSKPCDINRTLRIITDLKEEGEIDLRTQGQVTAK
jgi:hypothetical protein